MNFEPQKFFVGLIDFFAVWLPGALLVYLFKDDVGPLILGDQYKDLANTEGWIVFLFASYLLGHFVFLIGSFLLDDKVYDRIKRATEREQTLNLAKGENSSPPFFRWLARRLLDNDAALSKALKVRSHRLSSDVSSAAINSFQWSKATLTLNHPEALESIQRFEADSKFFRSLVVVCLIIFAVFVANLFFRFAYSQEIFERAGAYAWVALPTILLAFWRYVEQRLKATRQAYAYIITRARKSDLALANLSDGLTHAGGVVYRIRRSGPQYLLVQATKKPHNWVLPKGHIEKGETLRQTAVREVHEETGIWARADQELMDIEFESNEKPVVARFYLMQSTSRRYETITHWVSSARFGAKNLLRRVLRMKKSFRRKRTWMPYQTAKAELKSIPESEEVLKKADDTLRVLLRDAE